MVCFSWDREADIAAMGSRDLISRWEPRQGNRPAAGGSAVRIQASGAVGSILAPENDEYHFLR